MKQYINGSQKVRILHTSKGRQGGCKSSAFLIEVRDSGTIYQYIIPYAEYEADAVGRFIDGVVNLMEFTTLRTGAEDKTTEVFNTYADAFDVDLRRKLRLLEEEVANSNEEIELIEEELPTAILARDVGKIEFLQNRRVDLILSLSDIKDKIQKLKTTPLKTETTSVLELRLKKQQEILRLWAGGKVTARRLDGDRTYCVAYFDDERGEILHVQSKHDVALDPQHLPPYARLEE